MTCIPSICSKDANSLPLKPTPPLNERRRKDLGPFWWERIFCHFGWHQFVENCQHVQLKGTKLITRTIHQKECVCCGKKANEV